MQNSACYSNLNAIIHIVFAKNLLGELSEFLKKNSWSPSPAIIHDQIQKKMVY